jgi:nicotinate-nucleotide adenylyltransferase
VARSRSVVRWTVIHHLAIVPNAAVANDHRLTAILRFQHVVRSTIVSLAGWNRVTASRKLAVFGGTFDPVHIGHLIIAEIMRHHLKLERVIFLPAGQPPHKPDQILSADADRLAMLKLAIAGNDAFTISTVDLDRPGASYTADTLRVLQDQAGAHCQLHFLMGQDSLRDFPTWHRPDLIAERARLVVALRPGISVSVEQVEQAVPAARDRIELVPVPLIGISSRELRAAIRSGGPFRYQVLPKVADYIESRRLYQD